MLGKRLGGKCWGAGGLRPRKPAVVFPPLPHLRLCVATCRSPGSPRPEAGCSGQRCRTGTWDPGPAGCPSRACACSRRSRRCSILPSPATSPCHFPNSLEAQPFITGVLYSDRSVSIHIITYQASEWKTRVDSFVGRCPLTSCFIH